MSIKKNNPLPICSVNPSLGLLVAISAVSTASIFIRFAQGAYPSIVIAVFRLGLSSLILLPIYILKSNRTFQRLSGKEIFLIFISGFFLAAHFASWIYSLEMTNVLSSVVLVTTTPVWVSLFSFLLLKERLSSTFYLGLLVSLLGVIIISAGSICNYNKSGLNCPVNQILSGGDDGLAGNLLALLGAVFAAGYILCGKRLRPKINNLSYIFLVYSTASVFLIFSAILTGNMEEEFFRPEFKWLILLALIPQLIGHSLLNLSLGHLPASYVSISLLGEPVGSAILAYLILDEMPTVIQIAGAILVIAGIYTAVRKREKL